jgi:hypothetical protein
VPALARAWASSGSKHTVFVSTAWEGWVSPTVALAGSCVCATAATVVLLTLFWVKRRDWF